MPKLPLVTIGIPAFNEEGNIANLLRDLLKQTQSNFKIRRVFVASDGSTDATVAVAKSVRSRLIKVLSFPRQGKAARMMQLLRLSRGAIPVILDADIRITDRKFIHKLISPIIAGSADLTSAAQAEIPPTGIVDRCLFVSMLVLNRAYSQFRSGNNFFTCHGLARAFSPRLVRALKIPFSSGEDLYVYLFCRHQGFRYQYVPQAQVHYQLPKTLPDHFRQSSRFVQSINRIKPLFPNQLMEDELKLPYLHVAKYALIYFFRYPLPMALYVCVYIYSRLIANIGNFISDTWTISLSSKTLTQKT